jgi:hypothetical protein
LAKQAQEAASEMLAKQAAAGKFTIVIEVEDP